MLLPKTVGFILGVLVGVAGCFWIAMGGFAFPEPQDTNRAEVVVTKLKPDDQWLEKVHFQIVPLSGVLSLHKYAILLLIPPTGGVSHDPSASSTYLYLTSSASGGGLSISIQREDFGTNGDQVAVKFIDERFRTDKSSYYDQSQRFWIGSAPYP